MTLAGLQEHAVPSGRAPRADRRPRAGFRTAATTRLTIGPGGRSRAGRHRPGALGPSFDACRGRFGEFLAAAGVAAYRPSEGSGQPDFEQAAGAFVPEVRVLYGMAFPVTEGATMVRFESKGEPGDPAAPLSQLAEAASRKGEAIRWASFWSARPRGWSARRSGDRRSGLPDRARPVRTPPGPRLALADVRARARPQHRAGRRRGDTRRRAPRSRRSSGRSRAPGQPELQGHFHAAVVPYRPLPRGAFELAATVQLLFEPGRIESSCTCWATRGRSSGAGESTFTRGVLLVRSARPIARGWRRHDTA